MSTSHRRLFVHRRPLLLLLVVVSMLALSAHVLAQEAPAAGAAAGDAAGFQADSIGASTKIGRVRGLKSHVPEVHKVRMGDTLWSITAAYFKNPYLWPALWSYNPQITNPHWIYPEDLVFLKPAGASSSDASIRDLFAFSREIGVMVTPAGYYTDEDLSGAGRIVFSPEEKTMLTLHDETYLDWEDEEVRKRLVPGQKLAIYHEMPAVVDPDTDEEVAHKLRLVGTLKIAHNDGETLPTGLLTDVIQEIERGDLLLPYESILFRLMPAPNRTEAEGRIIDTFDIVTQLGEQQFVLIDLGSDHEVHTGNRFFVFEQREGIFDLPPGEEKHTIDEKGEVKQKSDKEKESEKEQAKLRRPGDQYWPEGAQPDAPRFRLDSDQEVEGRFDNTREYTRADLPLRQIGEIIVVKTSKNYATGIILDARREFNVGHRITLFSGY